jgi:hypothetical protein
MNENIPFGEEYPPSGGWRPAERREPGLMNLTALRFRLRGIEACMNKNIPLEQIEDEIAAFIKLSECLYAAVIYLEDRYGFSNRAAWGHVNYTVLNRKDLQGIRAYKENGVFTYKHYLEREGFLI